MSSSPAVSRACRSPRHGMGLATSPKGWEARSTPLHQLVRPVRAPTGATCGEGVALHGFVGEMCSPCWRREMLLGFMRSGLRPSCWDTASRSAPRDASRSPHIASCMPCVRDTDVVFLPTDHGGADELVDAADLAM